MLIDKTKTNAILSQILQRFQGTNISQFTLHKIRRYSMRGTSQVRTKNTWLYMEW